MIVIPLKDEQAKATNHKLRTMSLFFELNVTSYPAYFTTKDQDHTYDGVEYMSLKALYLELGDVTEYSFALAVFGRWATWQRLVANKEFMPIVANWRNELEVKIRSEAIQAIRNISGVEGAKGMAASKYLADKGWNDQAKRGRPTKSEVARERKMQAHIKEDLDDDAARLGLTH